MPKAKSKTPPKGGSAWDAMMSESARFFADRFQKDLEVQQALLACKTPEELMQVQTDFFNVAFQDYSQEAIRLFTAMSGVSATVPGFSRKYDDIPV